LRRHRMCEMVIKLLFVHMFQVDTNDYVDSNEWALLEHPAEKKLNYYSCCNEPYPDLTFRVKLKRIAVFYNYILVLPCVLLSFLTLVIFWLPPESPAKILLGKLYSMTYHVLKYLCFRVQSNQKVKTEKLYLYIYFNFC